MKKILKLIKIKLNLALKLTYMVNLITNFASINTIAPILKQVTQL